MQFLNDTCHISLHRRYKQGHDKFSLKAVRYLFHQQLKLPQKHNYVRLLSKYLHKWEQAYHCKNNRVMKIAFEHWKAGYSTQNNDRQLYIRHIHQAKQKDDTAVSFHTHKIVSKSFSKWRMYCIYVPSHSDHDIGNPSDIPYIMDHLDCWHYNVHWFLWESQWAMIHHCCLIQTWYKKEGKEDEKCTSTSALGYCHAIQRVEGTWLTCWSNLTVLKAWRQFHLAAKHKAQQELEAQLRYRARLIKVGLAQWIKVHSHHWLILLGCCRLASETRECNDTTWSGKNYQNI